MDDKYTQGVAYMLAMGVCGVILVALGSTLSDLATNCNSTATLMGTVFIARGCGAIIGALGSAKLYLWFRGNFVVALSMGLLAIILALLPLVTTVQGLHVLFLLMGFGTAVVDTGCQIMTRKIHAKKAGPWLGANTVAFGISGAMVPLIEIFSDSLSVTMYTLSFIVVGVMVLVLSVPDIKERGGSIEKGSPTPVRQESFVDPPHFHVEMAVAFMVFCYIGGKVSMTGYLASYVTDTGVIESSHSSYLILLLWIGVTVGRVAGVQDQRYVTNKTLPLHLGLFSLGGLVAMILILSFPSNSDALWIGILSYGLFNGPCVGYCYDWNNRLTFPTEKSMAIVMFGLNFGASLVPYLTTVIWSNGGGPMTLMWVNFLTMLLPLPLLYFSRYLSYDPHLNPVIRGGYEPLGTLDMDPEPIEPI